MTRTTLIATAILLTVAPAQAASFTCGWTQCKLAGISTKECRKRGLPLALNWSKEFPHVSAQPGAIVVQSRAGRALGGGRGGHVSKIVSLTDTCRAIVHDNAGTYERDICSRLVAYVLPSSSGVFASSESGTTNIFNR